MAVEKAKREAIVAVRDYLVELLQQENWCEADYYGGVLRKLVDFPSKQHTGIEAMYRAVEAQQMAGRR